MLLKILQYGLGIVLICLGIAGLFLPFLQGVLLIILGVFVLKAESLSHARKHLADKFRKIKKKLKRNNS